MPELAEITLSVSAQTSSAQYNAHIVHTHFFTISDEILNLNSEKSIVIIQCIK